MPAGMETPYELTLTVGMSARYHSLCERWFLKLNKLVTFCNVFLGSGVVATSLLSWPKELTAGMGSNTGNANHLSRKPSH